MVNGEYVIAGMVKGELTEDSLFTIHH